MSVYVYLSDHAVNLRKRLFKYTKGICLVGYQCLNLGMSKYIDLVNEARYWKKQAQQTDVRSEYFHYAISRCSELDKQIKQMAMSQEKVYNNSQIGNYKDAVDDYRLRLNKPNRLSDCYLAATAFIRSILIRFII